MPASCDASVDIRAFEAALKPILPRASSAVRSIALVPAGEDLRIEVQTKACTASAVLPKRGAWGCRVVTQGAMLARLAGKLGEGELKLTYAAGRLCLNRLSVPATDTPVAGNPPPLPPEKRQRIFCIDPPGPHSDIAVLYDFLKNLDDMAEDDSTVIALKREYEDIIRERRRRAH